MEEQLGPVAVTHLLQHTLRSLCTGDAPQWVYAVFWRILPRNYPPPKWDLPGAAYDRTRGNRRNWILAWEDGFCNFAAASSSAAASACGQEGAAAAAAVAYAGDCEAAVQDAVKHQHQQAQGLQPELFFKMSHDIYNYGEGPQPQVGVQGAPGARDEQPHLLLEQPCRLSSEDVGGAVPVRHPGNGGPELRGDAPPQVRVPREHPGGAAPAPVVGGRVRGRWVRGAPAGHRRGVVVGPDATAGRRRRAAAGALRPLRRRRDGRRARRRRRRRRRCVHAHHAVDEQPGGAALQAAVGRAAGAAASRVRARSSAAVQGRRLRRRAGAAVPWHGRRGGEQRRSSGREREPERRCLRAHVVVVVLLCQRGQ
uniref:Transcription factor MYC/MYB N-terminal domain-containing protein n=1 Tax=Zea mays TaxID=4577 RepID=A0A804UI94_MAIZE